MKLNLHRRRTLVIFACGFLLWQITTQTNHYLAPLGLYIWAGGLLVAFAGLRLGTRDGFWACFLIGLLIDALSPVPFGLHAFLLAIGQLLLVRVRHRFAAEETLVAVTVALLTNLALFVALAFLQLGRMPDPGAAGLRLLADLAVSQAFVALATPWFFALQNRGIEWAGAGLRDEAAESM